MVDHVKYLRRPVDIVIDGEPVDLVAIGYMANALGRAPWTIKYWTRLGLLPEAPFVMNPEGISNRRELYPSSFVEALVQIVERGYIRGRLDRNQWQRFQADVNEAYQMTVSPLLQGVGTRPIPETGVDVRRQAVSRVPAVV